MNYQEKVKEFQLLSGQPVSDTPRELTKEEYDFRDTLLREEIRELQYAIVDENRIEILDALCDIKYVNDGTANQMGIKQNDEELEIDFNHPINLKLALDFFEYSDITTRVNDVNRAVYSLVYRFDLSLKNFKTALYRVHESNMSKFSNDVKTAERTKEFYKKQGIDTYIEPREKKFVIYRSEDGKVLKSVDFWPPKLDDLV